MRLVVFVLSLFFIFTPSFAAAEQQNTSNTWETKSNVKLRNLKRYNLGAFQDPSKQEDMEDISELSSIRTLYVRPGYYWWIGRYITFTTTVRGRKRTGYILLSSNCNMRRRSIVHLYRDTWRRGQYKYFSPTKVE